LIISSRRSQHQRISPSPEPQPITTINQLSPLDLSHSSQLRNTIDTKPNQILSTTSIVSSSTVNNSNSLIDQSKMTNNHLQTPNLIDQQKLHLSDNVKKNI
jgi:hypothetical protein